MRIVELKITSGPDGRIYIVAECRTREGIASRGRGSECGFCRVLSRTSGLQDSGAERTVGKPYNLPVESAFETGSGLFAKLLGNRKLQ
jgi:hypothetical protein